MQEGHDQLHRQASALAFCTELILPRSDGDVFVRWRMAAGGWRVEEQDVLFRSSMASISLSAWLASLGRLDSMTLAVMLMGRSPPA